MTKRANSPPGKLARSSRDRTQAGRLPMEEVLVSPFVRAVASGTTRKAHTSAPLPCSSLARLPPSPTQAPLPLYGISTAWPTLARPRVTTPAAAEAPTLVIVFASPFTSVERFYPRTLGRMRAAPAAPHFPLVCARAISGARTQKPPLTVRPKACPSSAPSPVKLTGKRFPASHG